MVDEARVREAVTAMWRSVGITDGETPGGHRLASLARWLRFDERVTGATFGTSPWSGFPASAGDVLLGHLGISSLREMPIDTRAALAKVLGLREPPVPDWVHAGRYAYNHASDVHVRIQEVVCNAVVAQRPKLAAAIEAIYVEPVGLFLWNHTPPVARRPAGMPCGLCKQTIATHADGRYRGSDTMLLCRGCYDREVAAPRGGAAIGESSPRRARFVDIGSARVHLTSPADWPAEVSGLSVAGRCDGGNADMLRLMLGRPCRVAVEGQAPVYATIMRLDAVEDPTSFGYALNVRVDLQRDVLSEWYGASPRDVTAPGIDSTTQDLAWKGPVMGRSGSFSDTIYSNTAAAPFTLANVTAAVAHMKSMADADPRCSRCGWRHLTDGSVGDTCPTCAKLTESRWDVFRALCARGMSISAIQASYAAGKAVLPDGTVVEPGEEWDGPKGPVVVLPATAAGLFGGSPVVCCAHRGVDVFGLVDGVEPAVWLAKYTRRARGASPVPRTQDEAFRAALDTLLREDARLYPDFAGARKAGAVALSEWARVERRAVTVEYMREALTSMREYERHRGIGVEPRARAVELLGKWSDPRLAAVYERARRLHVS